MNKWTWRLVLALMVLITAAVGLHFCLSYLADGRLDEIKSRIQDQGGTLLLADLVPPVPDEENGALLYEKGMPLQKDHSDEEYGALMNLKKDIMRATPEDTAMLEQWLEKNKEHMALLNQGLAKPYCRHSIDYANPLKCKLPSLAQYRTAINLFNAEALLHARRGNEKEAYAACLKGIRLGKSLTTAPFLICHMLHIACVQSSLECLEAVMNHMDPEEEEYQALVRELWALSPFEVYKFALEGERCFGNNIFETLRGAIESKAQEMGSVKKAGFAEPSWIPDFILKLDQVEYLNQLEGFMEDLHVPYPAASMDWSIDKIKEDVPWYCIITFSSLWEHGLSVRVTGTLAANGDLARIALALVEHRKKHGALPESLDELDPQILENTPMDPFSGAPYHYRKHPEGGFVLYSIGENRRDDNGARVTGSTAKEGDLVWTWAPPALAR